MILTGIMLSMETFNQSKNNHLWKTIILTADNLKLTVLFFFVNFSSFGLFITKILFINYVYEEQRGYNGNQARSHWNGTADRE